VVALCEENRIHLILAISEVEGRLPIGSTFEITNATQIVGWKHDYKIAFAAEDIILFTNLMIVETFMHSQAFECKVFDNKRKAKKWLLTNTDK